MKIRNTEIIFVQGENELPQGSVRVDDLKIADLKKSEAAVRELCRQELEKAGRQGTESIVFPPLGIAGGFPAVGSAKIIIQEVLKFLKEKERGLGKVFLWVKDRAARKIFQDTITGYVTHIQTVLGDEPYSTVDIIIELTEGIILIERSNPPYGWALPGGFLDPGESLEAAAAREAKEETNMDLEDIRQFHTYSDPGRDPRFHTISTVFIAQGAGTPRFGDDAKGLKIVPYAELLGLEYAFDHKKIIQDYLEQKGL